MDRPFLSAPTTNDVSTDTMNASSNLMSVTRVVPRTGSAPAPHRAPRRGPASVEYRALHALVMSLALVGAAVARLLPFGRAASRRLPLRTEARNVADSVVPFVFQVA